MSVRITIQRPLPAVESIRRWWQTMGCQACPNARQLLITADSGGSNGARVRLWKVALQSFANETGLEIMVGHFPPGTSKWNKIVHRWLNGLDPGTWLKDTLVKIPTWPNSRINELLPLAGVQSEKNRVG